MNIIAVVNRRGGAGKTATAHAIGAGLALKGHRVLFIDLDPQTNLSFDIGARTDQLTIMNVLNRDITADKAIQKTIGGDIIAGSPSLAIADIVLSGAGKERILKKALLNITSYYDYCIIDTPPALGVLTVNALTTAHKVIIPAQAEIHSLQGIGLLHETIQAVQKYTNPALRIEGILITRYNGRAILSKDMLENLKATAKELGTKVFSHPIRECIAIKEAQALQKDIYSYSPRSNAAKDYKAVIEEILSD